MKATIKGKKIIVELDIEKLTPSSTGKSLNFASTHGPRKGPEYKGSTSRVLCTCWIKNPDYVPPKKTKKKVKSKKRK